MNEDEASGECRWCLSRGWAMVEEHDGGLRIVACPECHRFSSNRVACLAAARTLQEALTLYDSALAPSVRWAQ